MNLILNREQSRELDRRAAEEFGLPTLILMENAGRGIAEFLLSIPISGNIVICCGKGNNGGDGLVIARYLDNLNFKVTILLFANPSELAGDAKVNYQIAVKSGIEIIVVENDSIELIHSKLSKANWLIDGLFGTGLKGPVQPPFQEIIDAMNRSPGQVVSIDIPSGLDCDTGMPLGIAVQASYTATIASLKKGFSNPGAKKFLGRVQVIDIGFPKKLLDRGHAVA